MSEEVPSLSGEIVEFDKQFRFSPGKSTETNAITSISVAKSGHQVYAGTASGEIHLFERRVDGSWFHSLTWVAHHESVDVHLRQSIRGTIIDTDIFPIQRKCPLLITAGLREIRIWSISERLDPVCNFQFSGDKLEFPPVQERERHIGVNEISLIQTRDSSFFGSVRACQDGTTFAYTEDKGLFVRRVDNIEPCLEVYTSDHVLTRVDVHPNRYDLVLVGDENGCCNVLDLRIQTTQTTPTVRTNGRSRLADRFTYVADCRFSPDGSTFFTRFFGDLMLWDYRNPSAPLFHTSVPPDCPDTMHMSNDGRDFFRSTWISSTEVATGWIGGDIFGFNMDGVARHMLDGSLKNPKKFVYHRNKLETARRHCAHSIDVAPGGTIAAASNGGDVIIYNLVNQ